MMKPLSRLLLIVTLCPLLVSITFAQTKPNPFALTVDNIMRAEALIGYAPRAVYWSQDSKRIYFEWKKASEPLLKEYGHYVVNADGSGLKALTEEEAKLSPPMGGDLSPDKRTTLYAEEGDIYLYDHATGKRLQITATTEFESNPHFMPDGKQITYERQGNLYLMSLTDGQLRQLTDIRRDAGGATPPVGGAGRGGGFGRGGGGRGGNGPRADASGQSDSAQSNNAPPRGNSADTSQDVLKKTEKELFETVRDRIQQRDEQDAKRKQQEKGRRKPYNLATGQNAFGLQLSGDGLYVSLAVREGGEGKSTVIANFITESGYAEDLPGRGLVGDVQGRSRMVILNVETGEAKPVEFIPPPITAVGVKERTRQVNWFNWQWSEDGKRAVVMARATDNKDLWLLSVDPATGKTTVLAQTHDEAWVGGPGSFALGFLPDNRHVYFVSERDGYAHLYTVSTDGGTPKQLTQGKFEVTQVRLSDDKRRFYFVSSEAGPAERNLYTMPIEGGTRTLVTHLSAADEDLYTVAPDDQTLAVIRSTSNRPPELFLLPNPIANHSSASAVQVTHSPTDEWLSYPWLAPPIVSIPTRDGATLYARLYKPAKWRRNGPAVLFVHGAGYLQNVHNWWSHYYREYMFNHLLMEHGYLVLDADYRGSAGYGRDWRVGIYRHMGGKDLDDEVDAAKWLTTTYGVNPKRIGLYGGSYGGFLTLMALFTAPDVFAAGAALRPVTDWAHYNHGYTANILNEPQNDPEAYRLSSPIFFADKLKGALLICHGMVDDNVLFQDSVLLTERLIELHKENWELAVYPVESHGFTQPASWADEYKRILKLFDTNLRH
jgi:dipeptidyl aminopeptidase/acylaminoacyl peptidase